MKAVKLTQQEFALVAVHKQLELAEVDTSVLQTDKEWFTNYTMTREQHKQWKDWFIEQFRLNFKRPKKEALREFQWFDLGYGLRIKDPEQTQ